MDTGSMATQFPFFPRLGLSPTPPIPEQSGAGNSTQVLPSTSRVQPDNSDMYMHAMELNIREAKRFLQA